MGLKNLVVNGQNPIALEASERLLADFLALLRDPRMGHVGHFHDQRQILTPE
jgi:hypothetical protein